MPTIPMLGNIKSRAELQDDLFCLQEERDYFQSKFLEQVSEIKAMKDELEKSKKEIRRLRMFLMEQENHPTNIMPDQIQTPKNANREAFVAIEDDDDDSNLHIAEKDDASSLTEEEIEELDEQDARLEEEGVSTPPIIDEAKKEDEDVRQSAEKLLAWASYRSNMSSRASRTGSHNADHSSVMSPSVMTSGSARQSLLGKMIETLEDEEESIKSPLKTDHIEEKKEEEPLEKASLSLED
mmetsp:Transcript_10001/g.24962  ORF Transcript_10001/g.24962 Transcript_10001/m.24962 type:complete len:239 (+) Transcript_10001:268-984(+)|eukprot:CAMPEP_0116093340 /NCGR_PEP_ID=MMETSP0327-20121206/8545_1 /TAXON_ID=44447 /ORGANISM="Pseudo-nitzschia delicatissima, Strain B596" /LENGTH=238 /DNA_ID=CAMNT_0003584869 /DNA_START=258 /DNA_END=974 /DNA_ORIENTATION=-